jgi:hypothetical protein
MASFESLNLKLGGILLRKTLRCLLFSFPPLSLNFRHTGQFFPNFAEF